MNHPVFRRLLCALLAWVLVLGTLPVTALAEEPALLEEVTDSEITVETAAEVTEETADEVTEETVAEVTEETVAETTGETLPEETEEMLLLEAEQVAAAPEDDGQVFEIPFQVNPLYEGIVDPSDYEDWEPEVIAPSTYALQDEYLTEEEAAKLIRAYMCDRVESFTVYFVTEKEEYVKADIQALLDQAMEHTGFPTEGDYLAWQYAGWKASYSHSIADGVYQYTMTFTVPYYTTAEQEQWVDGEIDSLLTVLGLNGKSAYEKAKGIYDYICKNVTYDNKNLNDDSYKLKFTAYAALHDKTAVCQGYALLLYRLALELGVDCRFISGIGGGGPHGWNIIQLGDKYYNADSTWDAGKSTYSYFLKGTEFNSNHVRDDKYDTDAFNAAYPMDTENYVPGTVVPQAGCGENLLWKVQDGTLTIYAADTGTPGAMTDYSEAVPAPWAGLADQITAIDMQAGTTIGANAFKDLSKAAYIRLPDTLENVTPGAFAGCTALTNFVIESGETIGRYFADGPVLLQFTDSMGIGVAIVSPSVEGHFDMPNYGVLFPGALLGCENITSIRFRDYCRYLLNGSLEGCAEELTLFFEGTEPPYIGEQAFAGHVVTIASCPVTQSWKEVARDGSYGGTAIWPDGLLDLGVELVLKCGDKVLGGTLDADMSVGTVLTLSAQILPTNTPQTVVWTSSNTRVAEVDRETGAVTLNYPGTAVITANAADGSDVTASVTLNVFYLDPAEKLTAAVELPSIGLQPGQDTAMVVSGISVIAANHLNFHSSNEAIAKVDASGTITGGDTPGTAVITASLRGDPLERTVSVRIPVIALQAEAMKLAVNGEDQTELALAKSAESRTYPLTARMRNYREEWVDTANVRWSSSDTSVAKITFAKDGTAVLTIPGGVTGECVITAVSKDLNKVSAQTVISVRDYAPRLLTNKLTLNCYTDAGAAVDLRESYGNSIQKLTLRESSGTNEISTRFTIRADGTVQAAEELKNGTYSQLLDVLCSDGLTYRYSLQIRAANSLPSVSVKQTEKFNLFYLNSTAKLNIIASGQTIEHVELADTNDFSVNYSKESGTATIAYSNTFLENPAAKPDTRATLKIWLDGYNEPVSKTITISTVTTAPKLTADPASSVINTALSGNRTAVLRVLNKVTGYYVNLSEAEVTCTASFADVSVEAERLYLTLKAGKTGGTATIYVREPGWASGVKLTHKVTVSTKAPTLKLGTATLKLNSYFTQQTAQTSVTLSQTNLTLDSVKLPVSTAREGTSTRGQADKIGWEYDAETQSLTAYFEEPADIPKAGTYSFVYSGTLSDGTPITGGTVRVTVSSDLPRVKLSATSIKLNQTLAGAETVKITPTITGGAGYTLVGFEGAREWQTFEEGVLRVSLPEGAAVGKYTLSLRPVLRQDGTGQEVTLPTALKLTVQVYNGTPKVTLSSKGKLDTLNPDSAIVYTPRLTNCVGTITGAELDEQYSRNFSVEAVDGTVRLTLKEGEAYATNVTYKVRFRLTVCGQTILSPVLSVRVTQSTMKVTASPLTLTLFQSQSAPLSGKLTVSVGEIEKVAVSARSSSELVAALGENGFHAQLSGKTAALELAVQNTGLLKAGKSYTLYLDVTPKNNAVNRNPIQVRLTVKVLK